jgi:hypothetical protein
MTLEYASIVLNHDTQTFEVTLKSGELLELSVDFVKLLMSHVPVEQHGLDEAVDLMSSSPA